ncbi:LuxR C-terminal-related transcriptional regulator [Methylomonas koyamae]|uniref:LuxR C-terminal-related transcriptional regulator n=1 Tax=Methylomonas koyamae TaxID=702114 RepID=UPI0028735EDD|nr:LuxR C-terminal-related transcriptional regulator [Methylomonas koyamae]WNB75493.1 LuxR C-terminal-related transcriptional regulator [Methylomonas koyamae]
MVNCSSDSSAGADDCVLSRLSQLCANLAGVKTVAPMQQEVAQCVAEGLSYDHSAKRRQIKLTTVKDHIGKIYTNLNIRQRKELLLQLRAKAR